MLSYKCIRVCLIFLGPSTFKKCEYVLLSYCTLPERKTQEENEWVGFLYVFTSHLSTERTELMEMKIRGGEIFLKKVEELWSINFSYLFLRALMYMLVAFLNYGSSCGSLFDL